MRKLLALFLFFIPHPFNRLFRNLAGQKISNTARIHIFSFIYAKNVQIGERTTISPLSFLKANSIILGNDAHIAPLAIVNGPFMDGADITVGNFSRIFPFCWLEPGEGIKIGNHVGIGGHSLIFTHGVWSNFLQGGPVSFGPVVIEDNVWLPWRVFVMPNVTIGANSIIGANSTVTKSVPAHSLAAGSPAKVIKENMRIELSLEQFAKRCESLMSEYIIYCKRNHINPVVDSHLINFVSKQNTWGDGKEIIIDIDKSEVVNKTSADISSFIGFLRRYGIRVS